jgi:hypothetical protein
VRKFESRMTSSLKPARTRTGLWRVRARVDFGKDFSRGFGPGARLSDGLEQVVVAVEIEGSAICGEER